MRIAILASLTLTACAIDMRDDDDVTETPTSPTPPTPPTQPPASLDGTYHLRSTLGITAEVLLPEQLADGVAVLRDFSTSPGHAILDAADEAGVPAIGTLRDALPGFLEDEIEGWIDDEIAKVTIAGRPVTAYAGDLVALAETTLTTIDVESDLVVAGTTATHRLTALDLGDTRIALDVAGDVLEQTASCTRTGDQLAFGEQHFGVAYGEYAWRGIEAMSQALSGGSVREALGAAIDCTAIAQAVAKKCVLSVCVGHASTLAAACEGGLDAAVGYAHDRLAAMRFEALHLASGSATVAATAMTGTWAAELNAGNGLRHVPATFSGSR